MRGGGKYGLVTYDNEIVVPLEYDSGCAAVNGEGQSFFEKDGVYTVFDRDGRALLQTERTVRSINDGVVFAMDGSDIDASFAYYGLDGSVIYESDEEQWDKGADGFNEEYAVFMDRDVARMDRNGAMDSMTDLVHSENLTAQECAEGQDGDSDIVVDAVGYSFILDVPFGAVHDGYYLARSDIASSDSYGIYTLRGIDGHTVYSWDISYIFNREGLSFSDSYARWDFAGYYDDGSYYYNNGTCMCAYINVDGKKVYYLVDLAQMTWQDYVPDGEFWSDEAYWDFDRTVLTDEALLARADEIHMNAEKYWLTRLDGLWHYIDHYGKVMASYDGATDFYHGKARVIEDGIVCAIDDHFNKIKEFGTAEQVQNYGELFGQMVSLENVDS